MDRRAESDDQDLTGEGPDHDRPWSGRLSGLHAPLPGDSMLALVHRELLDSMFVLVAIIAADGEVLELNEPALELLGVPRREVIGRSLSDVAAMILTPFSQLEVRQFFQRARDGHTVRGE